ncbi:MAG: PilN domain-containing protein [Candidatus Omnitrophica bacterium]|nr:PilN domain-containing protein [Candidatus Omnitrophota bacterium]MCF7893663.1 PilN domain-containing protein [Candidatus Omnitrophota bacterium]
MKKLKINLNPRKPAVFGQGLGKVLDYIPLLILLVVFFALLVSGIGLFSLTKAAKYNGYKKIWKKWEPKSNQLADIKRDLSSLQREFNRIKDVLIPEYTGVMLLNSMFSALPKNIWFKNINFEQKAVEFEGYILKWDKDSLASLEDFINNLQENESFSKEFKTIDIKDTKRTNFNGVEVTQFIIKCKK